MGSKARLKDLETLDFIGQKMGYYEQYVADFLVRLEQLYQNYVISTQERIEQLAEQLKHIKSSIDSVKRAIQYASNASFEDPEEARANREYIADLNNQLSDLYEQQTTCANTKKQLEEYLHQLKNTYEHSDKEIRQIKSIIEKHFPNGREALDLIKEKVQAYINIPPIQ